MSYVDFPDKATLEDKLRICRAGLTSGNPKLAAACARSLGRLGSQAAAVVPELVDALWNPHPKTASEAANALSDIGVASGDVLEALVDTVWRGDREVYPAAIDAILKLDRQCPMFVDALMQLLNHSDPEVVGDMIRALGVCGDHSERVIVALGRCALYPIDHIAVSACRALANIGIPARRAAPMLLDRLEGADYVMAVHIVRALARMDAQDATRAVGIMSRLIHRAYGASPLGPAGGFDFMQSKDNPVMTEAALLMFEAAKWPSVAVPVLIDALEHEDPRITATAAWSLARLGASAAQALPALHKLVRHTDPNTASQSALALRRITEAMAMKRRTESAIGS
jgi:HEAT repeat protein